MNHRFCLARYIQHERMCRIYVSPSPDPDSFDERQSSLKGLVGYEEVQSWDFVLFLLITPRPSLLCSTGSDWYYNCVKKGVAQINQRSLGAEC